MAWQDYLPSLQQQGKMRTGSVVDSINFNYCLTWLCRDIRSLHPNPTLVCLFHIYIFDNFQFKHMSTLLNWLKTWFHPFEPRKPWRQLSVNRHQIFEDTSSNVWKEALVLTWHKKNGLKSQSWASQGHRAGFINFSALRAQLTVVLTSAGQPDTCWAGCCSPSLG